MRLVHLSDLHIGKRVNEFSMLEDQEYILKKIVNIIDEEKPDALIIAGDIFDKSVPAAEALVLFDDFLVNLSKRNQKVFVISGNHDSPERIAFGNRLMNESGVHISPVYTGDIEPITLNDSYGSIDVYMLPFIKPMNVKRFYPDEEFYTYTDSVRIVINKMPIDTTRRNILITHQFVTGASRCESEDISVGGSDNIDVSVFDSFDYVALGHIHSPQSVSRDTVRYCGTPLKYSFSEVNQEKSVTVFEMKEKGEVVIKTIPLRPKRDMREIKGKYMEITSRSFYEGYNTRDYFHITLTDEEDVPDAIGKLRVIYPNIMKLDYDNKRTRMNSEIVGVDNMHRKNPIELFEEFYEKQNNKPFTNEQFELVSEMIEKIWEAGK